VFQAGGTLREDAIYIERKADKILLESLLKGSYCHIFAPRQIGKSSLRAKTVRKLRQKGMQCASVDIQRFGSTKITVDKWYASLIDEIARGLKLDFNLEDFWEQYHYKSSTEKWLQFIETIVYPDNKIDETLPNSQHVNLKRIFIFIDEIDIQTMRPFSSSVDDFFSSIRHICNQRAEDYFYNKIVFCLMGVVNVLDTASLNTSKRILLEDFTQEEMRQFTSFLEPIIKSPQKIISDIYRWTSGHPYMVQKICDELFSFKERKEIEYDIDLIDNTVYKIFLDGELDSTTLSTAERYFRKEYFGDITTKMLAVYKEILDKKSVYFETNNPCHEGLLNTGIVSIERHESTKLLKQRNQIFSKIFDYQWMKSYQEYLPDNEIFYQQPHNYETISIVGKGSTGIVFKAYDKNIKKIVAIKHLKKEFQSDPEFVKRQKNEASITANMKHDNIVQIFSWDQQQSAIIMEFIEGKTLKQILQEKKHLKEQDVINIGIQVSEGLQYAHCNHPDNCTVVHRDIKPSNLIWDNNGRIKITDFGVAKVINRMGYTEHSNMFVGTFDYMSPEQIHKANIDERSDIFSLGIVLYEIATGKRPFNHLDRRKSPEPLKNINPTVSDSLSDVIMKSISLNPDDRYQHANELTVDLKDCLSLLNLNRSTSITQKGTSSKLDNVSIRKKNELKMGFPFLISLIVIVLIGSFYIINQKEPNEHPLTKTILKTFITEPSNAKLFINGEFQGKTPVKISMEPGKYEITFERENYQTLIESVHVKNDSKPIQAKLNQIIQPVNMTFITDPPNARLIINNEYRAKTPSNILLPVGTYNISFELENFETYHSGDILIDATTPTIEVRLKRIKFKYTIQTTPPKASLFINNKFMGVTPCDVILLNGEYDLTLDLKGYHVYKVTFPVNSIHDSTVDIKLYPKNK